MSDILDAQASVDWAMTQLPSLSQRIETWLADNVYATIIDQPPPADDDVVVALQKESLPRFFNVEVGSLINVIRSSLDILATAIAYRYGVPQPDNAYFPVAGSCAMFRSGTYKGAKFVKSLPAQQKAVFESLRPYKGGNDTLYRLHHLDVMRKHRRLLMTAVRPSTFTLIGRGIIGQFTAVSTGWMPVSDQETVLGLIGKRRPPDCQMEVTTYVTLNEPHATTLPREPVTETLRNFSSLANSIFDLFR